ncbi:kinase-like protein, partial [Clavulina sp. PMI_390]
LDHPNILPFLGVYYQTNDSPPITILPLMEYGSLQDLLLGSPIGQEAFKRILLGTASGVVYLHSRYPPIIHGDLHPGNILLDVASNPYLCDFGLSRIQHEVTRTRTILQEAGRLRFLAPELSGGLLRRFRTSPATDVFSLAMSFYNTWSGNAPFPEIQNDIKVAGKYRKGHRPDCTYAVVSLGSGPEGHLWELLQEMWAQKPEFRPLSGLILARLE